MIRTVVSTILIFLVSAILAAAGQVSVDAELRLLLEENSRRPFENYFAANPHFDQVERLYFVRDFQPLWHLNSQESIDNFLLQVKEAGAEALISEQYQTDILEYLAECLTASLKAGVVADGSVVALNDILLTSLLLHYASDMFGSRSYQLNDDHQSEWDRWFIGFLLKYKGGAAGGDIGDIAASLVPAIPEYRSLRGKIAEYRQIDFLGGWRRIPSGPSLKEGMRDRRLSLIRQRLFLSGDLRNESNVATMYGATDVAAVKRFQRRHGLEADGVLGDKTRKLMNVSVEDKIVNMEANLERYRWLPRTLPDRRIEVNIADFHLDFFDDSQKRVGMPVIVGSTYRKTPVFSALMTYIDFSPSWHVPPTIFKEDLLPKIKKDPDYIRRNGYELVSWDGAEIFDSTAIDWQRISSRSVPGFLRKKPGPYNPLGRVKFMFPNPFAIYLHDTPNKSLFSKKDRTLSSGCIRVEQPVKLAKSLLSSEYGWNTRKIRAAMGRTDSSQRVVLSDPVEVFILYKTAWVDVNGELQFRKDIYGRDKKLVRLLQKSKDQLALN